MSARYARSWAGCSGSRENSAGPAKRRRTTRLRTVPVRVGSGDRAGRMANIRLLVGKPVGDNVVGHFSDRTGIVLVDVLDVDLDLQRVLEFQQQLQCGRRSQSEVSHQLLVLGDVRDLASHQAWHQIADVIDDSLPQVGV